MNNLMVRISYDEYAGNPREEFDELGTLWIKENRYFEGDKVLDDSFNIDDYYIALEVFAHIHSGVALSTASFSCPWDSGAYGYITLTKKEFMDEGFETKEQAINALRASVEHFSTYLRGAVYCYQVLELKKCDLGHTHEEHIDSCGGFYGYEYLKDMLEHWPSEVREAYENKTLKIVEP